MQDWLKLSHNSYCLFQILFNFTLLSRLMRPKKCRFLALFEKWIIFLEILHPNHLSFQSLFIFKFFLNFLLDFFKNIF